MRQDLEDALYLEFPNLYRWVPPDGAHGGTCYELSPGDGWEPLIRRLSERITGIVDRDNLDPQVHTAVQVKEKFGLLRFYMAAYTDDIRCAIEDAVTESARTCEKCGWPGELYRNRWWRTLCDGCAEKEGRPRKNTEKLKDKHEEKATEGTNPKYPCLSTCCRAYTHQMFLQSRAC